MKARIASLLGFCLLAALGGGSDVQAQATGSIVGWGYNEWGHCVVPEPNGRYIAIAAGDYHSLALIAGGVVVGWGESDYGQCDVPPAEEDYVRVAAGITHASAILSSLVGTDPGLAQPWMIALQPNFPNPFNPATRIEFMLSEAATIDLSIYDLLGRQLCSLVAGTRFEAGSHGLTWNGQRCGLPWSVCYTKGGCHARAACDFRDSHRRWTPVRDHLSCQC